jgi:hypothetical protein
MTLPVGSQGSREVEPTGELRAHPGFALAVFISLGLAGLIGLMVFLMQVRPGFLGMAHFTEAHHRIHDLTYGFLFTTPLVGLLAQLRRPSKNVAGMLMALVPWVALLLAAVLSTDADVIRSAERMLVAAGTIVAAVLHPARGGFFRSFSLSRVSWVTLGLVIVASVPLLAFASTNIGLQRAGTSEHAAMGHYGFMAAFSFTVIGVGLLASLRPDGWRLTAWVAGLLPVLLGMASLTLPGVDSSLDPAWAVAAIAWGALFVGAAVLSRDVDSRPQASAAETSLSASREKGEGQMDEPPPQPRVGMPRWVKVSGIVVAAVVVLLVVLMLTGVLGEHGPGQFGPGQHGP